MGKVASELLAQALAKPEDLAPPELKWTSRDLGLRVDLEDKEAVWAILDERAR